ncbi:CRISPR/Cas system-associated exonuclease Cas4 (RecB family) [Salibacterium salarium]|uniref:PD-(D/E)XK nuclease family protein n=1 Tax=Salibacterium salarium TaxID=284579 RepID=UPI002789F655|nr:PD-(D/E)XK nuclease family protein [Salibacterium salarium]MDQ0300782.1 CRISPR/Cas system-associated exonuclease Cas4 (RecB family) [Salibacterium salarium]
MFEIKTYPEFSWSLSRHKTLMHCARQYAHQYYTSHNGWLRDASQTSKHAYRLKNLTNLEMFFGSIVHDVIDHVIDEYLNTGYIPSEENLREQVRHQLNKGFVDSTKRYSNWWDRPKKTTMFHEIYYGNTSQLPQSKVDKITHRLHVTMHHFLTSQTMKELAYNEQIEFLEAEKFRILQVGQLKVFVVLDLLYKDLDRTKWVIVDWKTGKQSEEDPYQLALYVLYLLQTYEVDSLDDIIIRNEYLLEGEHVEHQLDPVTLEKVQELIGSSVEWMTKYLEDASENQPLPLESFPQTSDQKACTYCNFYELCFP